MDSEQYSVHLTSHAQKDLEALKGLRPKMEAALRRLETDPAAGHTLGGALHSVRSLEVSLPGGAYRAAYAVLPEQRVCLVLIIGPHEGFYQRAVRRVQSIGWKLVKRDGGMRGRPKPRSRKRRTKPS
jgi:mRNA-degrading endonuclease RelE of RelBE toxin-antitoxin system